MLPASARAAIILSSDRKVGISPMSIRVMTRVWADSKQSEGSLLVLLSMADHADDGGVCFPSQERLADRARLSVRQVRRVIDRLVMEGELKVLREGVGRGKRTVYKVLTGDSQQKEDNMSAFTKNDIKADIGDTKKRTLATPSIIKEPSLEPSVTRAGVLESQLSRLCAIFHKRPKTPLDRSEKTAWATLTNKGKRPLDEDELSMVERFYKRNWPPNRDKNNLRHALAQLMNNFGGEVDKARTWCAKYPAKPERKIVHRNDGPILEAALAARPPELSPAETKKFCENFERQFKRLPAGYKRDGEEIIFTGSANGAHAQ
jgi:hypothetical protein